MGLAAIIGAGLSGVAAILSAIAAVITAKRKKPIASSYWEDAGKTLDATFDLARANAQMLLKHLEDSEDWRRKVAHHINLPDDIAKNGD